MKVKILSRIGMYLDSPNVILLIGYLIYLAYSYKRVVGRLVVNISHQPSHYLFNFTLLPTIYNPPFKPTFRIYLLSLPPKPISIKMRFTIVGLVSLAMAVAAIPSPEGKPHANSKPDSVNVSPQCGTQIIACCSNIYFDVKKRQLDTIVAGLVGTVDGLLGTLSIGGDTKNCYNHNQGAVCQGTVACCPGNGNKVSYSLLSSFIVSY